MIDDGLDLASAKYICKCLNRSGPNVNKNNAKKMSSEKWGRRRREDLGGVARAHHLPTLAHPKMSEWVMDARENFSNV